MGRFESRRQCFFPFRHLGSCPHDSIGQAHRARSSAHHTPGHVVWEYVARKYRSLQGAQVQAMSQKMDRRMEGDSDSARASGIIVNTNWWIQDVSKYDIVTSEGMQLYTNLSLYLGWLSKHTTKHAMCITVILVMGHDRLYSMLKNQFDKEIKIIKLPRSGGLVSRDTAFQRQSRSLTMKWYFHGDTVPQQYVCPMLDTLRKSLYNDMSFTSFSVIKMLAATDFSYQSYPNILDMSR
jgi:mRNA cleavage and polyadenylation factor CLP1 P-loop